MATTLETMTKYPDSLDNGLMARKTKSSPRGAGAVLAGAHHHHLNYNQLTL
jgi:hypothetical protein